MKTREGSYAGVVLEKVPPRFEALKQDKEADILSQFTVEQQTEIKHKQQILSSLAYFIGKDFRIPVELNESGQGWHWDFQANIIRIDPQDLLEKPMDYLRFVISHEGGHRRISRTDFIPLEEWQQPGFSFMMNAIEDPRDNNFVAESYPKFREQMALAYQEDLDFEAKAKDKAADTLGYRPRFMQAGFEYIKQWFRETQDKEFELAKDLPKEVKRVVGDTLEAAQDSWWRYPSRPEADSGETIIRKYAEASYKINRDRIWPEFQKLVEQDMEDEKLQELMKDMQQQQNQEGGGQGLPQELKNKLTPEEQQQLEKAINQAIEEAKSQQGKDGQQEEQGGKPQPTTKPIDLDSLSEELKQKLKEYIDSLSEEQQKELAEKAEAVLKEFEKALNEELQGKFSENPEQRVERESHEEHPKPRQESQKPKGDQPTRSEYDEKELEKYRKQLRKELKSDENAYEKIRREVLPIIDKLENDLREIFVKRRAKGLESGRKTGKRISMKKRIQEKAKDIPAVESHAWERRELPQEKDYAITLLVDLSGSMVESNKIKETFKAVVVLAEVLNRLSIEIEVLGFNDRIYEYQNFGEPFSKMIRENMGGMLREVHDSSDTGKARYNDDGWALEQASERLKTQKVNQKFLIVLSDGLPAESPMHSRSQYELGKMIKQVIENTNQKLIGLGVGGGTGHVANYYPHSLANVEAKEMADELARLIKDVIANYDKF